MKIPLVLMLACLPWPVLHAQDSSPAAKEGETLERTIRLIIAGQRPMPKFEKQGDQYVEVEPSTKWIAPSSVELIAASKTDANATAGERESAKTVWPNEVTNLGKRKCSSSLRLRLLRTLAKQAHTPPEIACEIGDLKEPLLVLSAANDSRGWDSPRVTVIDLSADKVPFRTVVALNLTAVTLVTRFESESGQLAPSAMRQLHLPAIASDVFRFRIDAQAKDSMVPLANSSYQIGPKDRLILLAVPNLQVPPGAPPLSLQLVLYGSGL
jgi:hypothetical protein